MIKPILASATSISITFFFFFAKFQNFKPSNGNPEIPTRNPSFQIRCRFKALAFSPYSTLAISVKPLRYLRSAKPQLPRRSPSTTTLTEQFDRFQNWKRHRLGQRLLRPYRPMRVRVRAVLRFPPPPSSFHSPVIALR